MAIVAEPQFLEFQVVNSHSMSIGGMKAQTDLIDSDPEPIGRKILVTANVGL